MQLSLPEIEKFRSALNSIAAESQNDFEDMLRTLWLTQGKGDPALLRKIVNQVAPTLAEKYGVAAGELSAEMFETIYHADTGHTLEAILDNPNVEKMFSSDVGYALRNGENTDSEQAISYLKQVMGRAVLQYARGTTTKNNRRASSRGYAARYARIPSSGCTCAFCLMLGSRGFVYQSEDTAGEFDLYHNDCRCVIVSSFDKDNEAIDGYDPSEWYAMYDNAAKQAGYDSIHSRVGDSATSSILAKGRELYGWH